MDTETGYNSNPVVPSSSFSIKPVGSIDWSSVSDESISSLHTENVSLSQEHEIVELDDVLKLDETHKSNELVHQIPETNPVLSLLHVKETQDSENDDEDYDESKGEEHNIPAASCKQDGEERKEVEDDGYDADESMHDDSSICCHSDASNNSVSSFTFPILNNEDGSVKTRWNVFDRWLELSQQQTQPQQKFYFISAIHTLIPQLPPQNKSSLSKQASETQPRKTFRNRWFSCFCCPF